jgi:hypothetical protein
MIGRLVHRAEVLALKAAPTGSATATSTDPTDASPIRLVSTLAIEANGEWLVGRGYINQRSTAIADPSRVAPSAGEGVELLAAA